MKKCTKEVVNERITLRANKDLVDQISSICTICGEEAYSDMNGLYYFIEGTYSFVCEPCAKKKAPELVSIREEALSAICMGQLNISRHIIGSIRAVIREPLDKRIVDAVDKIYQNQHQIVNKRLEQ